MRRKRETVSSDLSPTYSTEVGSVNAENVHVVVNYNYN